jgi:hypothetical protein
MTAYTITDGTNTQQTLAVSLVTGNLLANYTIGDPVSGTAANILGGALATVTIAHSANNGSHANINTGLAGSLWEMNPADGGGQSNMYILDICNLNNAVAYVQIFFKYLGQAILGTTAPDIIIPLSANQARTINFSVPIGAQSIGLTAACTTTPTGSTGGLCVLSVGYG